VRREAAEVGDLEFIAPMPAHDDPLHDALQRHFWPAKPAKGAKAQQHNLFAPVVERGEQHGVAVMGLRPGFRMCSLVLHIQRPTELKLAVQIFRYDAGPEGNRGWIEMIRTGPSDVSHALVTRWQQVRGRPAEPGSVDGYPIDRAGNRIATPSEEAVWELLELTPLAPTRRTLVAIREADAAWRAARRGNQTPTPNGSFPVARPKNAPVGTNAVAQ
jgi:hypothetical protein